MRRPKLISKSNRARRLATAAGILLIAAVLPSPALALQVTPPDAATKAAMDRRTTARTVLSSALGRIGSNPDDSAALLDAGRASISLEDFRAALGFLLRAEKAAPRDGAIKAALGSAMVHMENPTRALDYFGEAQLLGAPERIMLADRGLARDLLGQQDAAQRDYQLALSVGTNDELIRRFALSLGISGDLDRAIQLLTPQLRTQDRAAWRSRAMILAMNGRDKEATEIVNATMPPALAQNILPYLVQMDRLNPAQQAAAAHFGRFPTGKLGPSRKPVQMAGAATTPPPAPIVDSKRSDGARARPAAATATRATTESAPAVRSSPREVALADVPAKPAASAPPPPAQILTQPATTRTATPAPAAAAAPAASAAATESTEFAVKPDAGPIGPGFSLADVGQTTASRAVSSDLPGPIPAAPLASLAEIVGSIEIPPEELSRPDNAIGADTLARLQQDKRKAEAVEAAQREKDEAAAKAKAEADAKARAAAAEKKAHPARLWVQIATGANEKALAFDFNRFAKKSLELFKGKSGGIAEWGKTRRLVIGPFKDRTAAQDWLASYKKDGGDGFLFSSDAGEIVDPIK